MSVPAQSGTFGIGIQNAKSTANVLDPTQVKANVSLASVAAIATPTSPATDSRIAFTVDVALGAGDASIEIIGLDAASDYQAEVVTIPALSPVGTRVFSAGTYKATTGITSMQVLEASAAGQCDIGAYDVATGVATTFYRYKAADINFGQVTDQRTFPLEVGDDITPTGGYKAGAFVGGGATLQPRLEGDFGWFLAALMGACTTTGAVATGYTHVFKFATGNAIPWVTGKKLIPGPLPVGEIGIDCKMTSVRFNVPPNGIVQARVDMLGRVPELAENPVWTWADAYEDFGSVPLSSKIGGFVKFPASGNALPIQSLVVTMINNLSSPQQEMIIGSPYPDDLVVLSRAMTIQAQLKWNDPYIYEQCVAAAQGQASLPWSDEPYKTTFQAKVLSPADVVGANAGIKNSLTIDAESVMWQPNGSPILAGGDMVVLPILGTVMRPTSGDYAKFTVLNGQASYILP